MKRLGCFLLILLLLLVGTVIPVSAQDPPLVLEIADANGEAGNTVTVAVQLSQNPGITSLKLSLNYDSASLSLTKAQKQPLLDGWYQASPTLDTLPYLAVWVASDVQNQIGELLLLEFKIAEDVAAGTILTPTLTVEEAYCNGFQVVSSSFQFNIEVICSHTYGAYTKTDVSWHTRECTKCHEIEKLAHIWDKGVVTTPATQTQTGTRTFTCSVCGAVKTEEIPKLDHIDPETTTGVNSGPSGDGTSKVTDKSEFLGGSNNQSHSENPVKSDSSGGSFITGLILGGVGIAIIAIIIIVIIKKRSDRPSVDSEKDSTTSEQEEDKQ